MFEAHTLYSTELHTASAVVLPIRRYQRFHLKQLIPLSIWFVEGTTQCAGESPKRAVFVYTEYCDQQGNNRAVCQCYPYPEFLQQQTIENWLKQAASRPLQV